MTQEHGVSWACFPFAHPQPPGCVREQTREPGVCKVKKTFTPGEQMSLGSPSRKGNQARKPEMGFAGSRGPASMQRFCPSGLDSLCSLSLLCPFEEEISSRMWCLSRHVNLCKAVTITPSVTHWPSSWFLLYASSNSTQLISNPLPTFIQHPLCSRTGNSRCRQIGPSLVPRGAYNLVVWDCKWNYIY